MKFCCRREASYDYRAATPLSPYYPGVFDTLAPAAAVPVTNGSGKVFELDPVTYAPTGVASNFDYPVQNPAGSADDGTVQARPASEVYDTHSFFNSETTSDSDVFEYRFISNETSSFGLPLNWTAGAFFFEEDQTVFWVLPTIGCGQIIWDLSLIQSQNQAKALYLTEPMMLSIISVDGRLSPQ